jgi:hypothetical protein
MAGRIKFASSKPADVNESIVHFCQERRGWWCVSLDAVIMLMTIAGLIGLIIACINTVSINGLTQQSIVNQGGTLSASLQSVYITTNSPIVLNLPKDLESYAGRTFHVDCAYAGHSVVILPGGAVWNAPGTATTATCASVNSGFSFRVVAKDKIRVISAVNVNFT